MQIRMKTNNKQHGQQKAITRTNGSSTVGSRPKFLLAAAAICAFTLVSALTASAGNLYRPTALTESGVVIGLAKNGMNQFLGISLRRPARRKSALEAVQALRPISGRRAPGHAIRQ